MRHLRHPWVSPRLSSSLGEDLEGCWTWPSLFCSIIEYIQDMQEQIDQVAPTVKQHMEEAQAEEQQTYNWPVQPRGFQLGNQVLLLLPSTTCMFLAHWQGPYTVFECKGPVPNYCWQQSGKQPSTQMYHVKLLRQWIEPAPCLLSICGCPHRTPRVKLGPKVRSPNPFTAARNKS